MVLDTVLSADGSLEVTRKYQVHNHLTGISEEAQTFEKALQLRDRLKAEYIAAVVDPIFIPTILELNEDGSWLQSLSDENGDPIIQAPVQPLGLTGEDNPEPMGQLIGGRISDGVTAYSSCDIRP